MGRKLNDDFWRGVHEENLASEVPSKQIFTRMLESLAFVSEDRAILTLSEALALPTDFNDSHPSLGDRLRLIGYWTTGDLPQLPGPVDTDAATAFLQGSKDKFVSQFDASWDEQTDQSWKAKHQYFKETNSRVAQLEQKRSAGESSLEDLWEIARLVTEKDGVEAAIPYIEEAAERFPENGVALYNLGHAKLSQNDDTGLIHLDRAVDLDQTLRFDAGELAFDYLRGRGRIEEAKKYAGIIDEQNEVYEKANKERAAAQPTDSFAKHDLDPEFVASIPAKLAGLDEITALYAAHKVVEHMPEIPFRVLFIELRPKGRLKNRHDAKPTAILDIVVDRLSSGEFQYFAILDHNWGNIAERLDQIPGARIYRQRGNGRGETE